MIHLILLAAGNSRRFGSNKLRFSLDGKPLYRHTLDKLLSVSASYPDCHVYTVTQYEDILEELELLRDSLLGLPCEHSFCPLCNTSSAESNNITSSAIMPSDKHSGFLHPVFSPESSQGISYSIREGITCAMETEILFAEGMIPDMRNSAFFFSWQISLI